MPSLQIDYRPTTFDEFYGNENEIESLRSILNRDPSKYPHAFLFTGPSGCGKTTLARLVARTLGVYDTINYRELNSSDFRGIDTIREIKNMFHLQAIHPGKYRVWLMDECHQLTRDAQEAFLKMLEEPPSHVFFLLCTTEPEKLKDTLKRRCTIIALDPLDDDVLEELLTEICEDAEAKVSKKVIQQIVRDSFGSPGKAVCTLDKIIDMESGDQVRAAKQSAEVEVDAIELCRLLMKTKKWKEVATLLTKLKGEDPEKLRRLILSYCASILLNGDNPKAALILACMSEPFYNTGFPGLVLACHQIFFE